MAAKAFISYSHADGRGLERLHKHLAMLQRDQLIAAWFDSAILAGSQLAGEIAAELDNSEVFLALVSPDYLASGYCYEKEFERALDLFKGGRIRIIPIILEPCDWLSSPLSQFMALPKDGKPVSEWTNANNAFLDIVTGLRRVIQSLEPVKKDVLSKSSSDNVGSSTRRMRLRRDFDVIERAEFADRTFEVIKDYFKKASVELAGASEDLRTRVQEITPTAFTASLVNRAKLRHAEAHITVHNVKRRNGFGDISYSFEAHAADNTAHGGIRVEADDYNLYLNVDGFMAARESTKYTPDLAAEWL
jgi:hypothetical protein